MIREYWFLYGPIIIAIIYQIILAIPYSIVDDFVKFYNNYTGEVLTVIVMVWFLYSALKIDEIDLDVTEFNKKSLLDKVKNMSNLVIIISYFCILIYLIILNIHIFFDKHLTIKLKKDDN